MIYNYSAHRIVTIYIFLVFFSFFNIHVSNLNNSLFALNSIYFSDFRYSLALQNSDLCRVMTMSEELRPTGHVQACLFMEALKRSFYFSCTMLGKPS